MFLFIFLILWCAPLFMLPTKLQLKEGPLWTIVYTSKSFNRIFETSLILICILCYAACCQSQWHATPRTYAHRSDCHIGQAFCVPHPEVPL